MASDLRPALIGSAVLHLSLLAAGLIAWPHFSKPLATAPVAVKLVARAPVADVRPAVEAPEPAPAAAPETAPEPVETPEPAPSPPTPTPPAPTPPTPTPPKPAPPKPPPPKPTPAPAAPAPPKPAPPEPPALDLDALASKLPKSKPRPALDLNALAAKLPKQAANARKGALRPETAAEARQAAGAAQGLSADEASLLAAKLNRLWHPNCAEGASNVQVVVNIQLTQSGTLAAPPRLLGGGQMNDPVWLAAAQRALSAVAQGAPYNELPRDRFSVWKDINFRFNGQQACRGG